MFSIVRFCFIVYFHLFYPRSWTSSSFSYVTSSSWSLTFHFSSLLEMGMPVRASRSAYTWHIGLKHLTNPRRLQSRLTPADVICFSTKVIFRTSSLVSSIYSLTFPRFHRDVCTLLQCRSAGESWLRNYQDLLNDTCCFCPSYCPSAILFRIANLFPDFTSFENWSWWRGSA